MKLKKTPWWIIALSILLLGAIGVFAYKYFQLRQQLNSQSLPSASIKDPRYLGPPKSVTPQSSSSPNVIGKTIRVEVGVFEKVGPELLKTGPVTVAVVSPDNKLAEYDQNLTRLAAITDNVVKIVGLSSYSTLSSKLSDASHVAYLKSIGVDGFTYNTERQHTPLEEMSSLKVKGDANFAVKFAKLASSNGFKSYWVPTENVLSAVDQNALASMFEAGLTGVIIQQQRQVENACVSDAATVLSQTINKIKLASNNQAQIGIQLMTTRCLNGDQYGAQACGETGVRWSHCSAFVDEFQDEVSILSIWTPTKQNLQELLEFIQAINF
jgi:hypothetical protein